MWNELSIVFFLVVLMAATFINKLKEMNTNISSMSRDNAELRNKVERLEKLMQSELLFKPCYKYLNFCNVCGCCNR